jgi:hypothetical protein
MVDFFVPQIGLLINEKSPEKKFPERKFPSPRGVACRGKACLAPT